MTKQQILDNVRSLPRNEQVDLAMELWDMVEVSDAELALTEPQKRELDRRIESLEKNPTDTRPWGKVREEIIRELRTS